jgi:sec-independent protein translocase protein TatA
MIASIAGPDSLIILLVVVVVLFGSTQLPKLARSIGQAKTELKRASEEHPEPVAVAVVTPAPASTPVHATVPVTPTTVTVPSDHLVS